MKVLDLECGDGHVFEGWFASEEDFRNQRERSLIECPVCGTASVSKKLSAPRLNLAGFTSEDAAPAQATVALAGAEQTLQAAWMTMARRVLASTDDVGERFAEEARKIHYGESKERGIRGQATRAETESLIEEGLAVMQFPVPQALKGPLQ
jgi:hypothetical protein